MAEIDVKNYSEDPLKKIIRSYTLRADGKNDIMRTTRSGSRRI